MSGTVYLRWALMNTRYLATRNQKLSAATNCPLGNSREYVDCLRQMDGRTLARKLLRLFVRKLIEKLTTHLIQRVISIAVYSRTLVPYQLLYLGQ